MGWGSSTGRRAFRVGSGSDLRGAVAGLLAAGAALGTAELAAGAVRPTASPVAAVGQAVIEVVPGPVERWAIDLFGTADKAVLQGGVVLLTALLAACAGAAAVRTGRLWPALAGAAALLVAGTAALLTAEESGGLDLVPLWLGAAVGLVVFRLLWRQARAVQEPVGAAEPQDTAQPMGAPERRRFVATALAVAAGSAAAGTGGRALGRGGQDAAADRTAVRLPEPSSQAPALPAGVAADVPGAPPFTTPTKDFYRIDTALIVPRVDAERWALRIHGLGVGKDLTIGYRALLRRPMIERDITLACVSNEVGGNLVGNARWIGVRLADLLEEAGVKPPSKGGRADHLVARSHDGMTLGAPVETVLDGRDAMLAVGMNGEVLPFKHGYPVRMVVPGLYGYVSACKWITELELTTYDAFDAYWTQRGWSARGEIKTQSRIDVPRGGGPVTAGRLAVAGTAWAQHRGIETVEVRVDGGAWQPARLAAEAGTDTWRQWQWTWDAEPGSHLLEVRATDKEGETQTGRRAPVTPDGATGWHGVRVDVR